MPCPNYRRERTISKAFRVTPEENHRIKLLADAAGITQQEYIMMAIERKDYVIVPNSRTYKMLRNEMHEVYQELCRLRDASDMDKFLKHRIDLLAEFFVGLEGKEYSPIEEEDSIIEEMGRS